MTESPDAFKSALGPIIGRYIALRRSLGRDCYSEYRVFVHLDRFVADRVGPAGDLTADVFEQWCLEQGHLRSGVRRERMRVVRNLCLYRSRVAPDCFVPDPDLFPPVHQRVRPHIFSSQQIGTLLQAALELPADSRCPLRPQTFHLAVVLLYTCGLRRREVVRLSVRDYDPFEKTLLVLASKFHKSRVVPLSRDASEAIDAYLTARSALGAPATPASPLLWRRGDRGYCVGGFAHRLRAVVRRTGIRTASGQTPRIHDIRHTFAVHALLRWYQAGADVQAKLPQLAAYMGHVSFVSTEYYLHFVQELSELASARFARSYGSLLSVIPHTGDTP